MNPTVGVHPEGLYLSCDNKDWRGAPFWSASGCGGLRRGHHEGVRYASQTCRSRPGCERRLRVESGPEAEQKIRLKSDHDQAAMERLEPVFRVW